ncbi:DoxX family protein [Streptomyces sp. NPDC086777]|uniref:DoxX family protein n=1 Tax=Streptomyces sp. NPDC086777 TaxID=3154866 RepID=UPI00344B5E4D
MTDPSMVDAGLLILRLTAGGLTICHGLQKFTRLFGGDGLAGAGDAFTALGFRGAVRTAAAAGGTQLLLGLMLVLGLATPLGGAALIGVMVVAALAHAPNGLWAQRGGFEYPLVLAAIGAALALTGPGTIALDTGLLNWRFPVGTGAAAMGIGVVSGLVTGLALRRAPLRQGTALPLQQAEGDG